MTESFGDIEIPANALSLSVDTQNKQVILEFFHQGLGESRVRVEYHVWHKFLEMIDSVRKNHPELEYDKK